MGGPDGENAAQDAHRLRTLSPGHPRREASRDLHVKHCWRAGCIERCPSGSDRGSPEKGLNHRYLAGGLPVFMTMVRSIAIQEALDVVGQLVANAELHQDWNWAETAMMAEIGRARRRDGPGADAGGPRARRLSRARAGHRRHTRCPTFLPFPQRNPSFSEGGRKAGPLSPEGGTTVPPFARAHSFAFELPSTPPSDYGFT